MRNLLTIGHLFPDVLNLYGDTGNILTLKNRLLRRDIDAEVLAFSIDDPIDFKKLDIVFLGGGAEREQALVYQKLLTCRAELCEFIESEGVLLAVCGGYELLGQCYKKQDAVIEGLGLLDIYTEEGENRIMGNVVVETEMTGEKLLVPGFENHAGRTYIGSCQPFGRVLCGRGNNGEDSTCGVLYKNVLGTYLHGPLLPKNPALADCLLSRAMLRKYGACTLLPLDDRAENEAHDFAVKQFLNQ